MTTVGRYRVTVINLDSGIEHDVSVEARGKPEAIAKVTRLGEVVVAAKLEAVLEQAATSQHSQKSIDEAAIPSPKSSLATLPPPLTRAAESPATLPTALPQPSAQRHAPMRPPTQTARKGNATDPATDALTFAYAGLIIPPLAVVAAIEGLIALYRSNGERGAGAAMLGFSGLAIWTAVALYALSTIQAQQ